MVVAASEHTRPVVRFRKIESHSASAAARPGDWHRLQLANTKAGGGTSVGRDSGHKSLAASRSFRFFAELGNGATAELLAGE